MWHWVSIEEEKQHTHKQEMSFSEEIFAQMFEGFVDLEPKVANSCYFRSTEPLQIDHSPTYFSLQEILGDATDSEREVYGKILLYLKDMKPMEKVNQLKKWIAFRLEMDHYEARFCTTSWITPFRGPSDDYEYVDVMMRKDNINGGRPIRLIVDIDFRSQFELARPTSSYAELINSLPLIFVGIDGKLEKLISLVCSAAKQSLKERGLHIPPWRKPSYMHSKWLSENCTRVSFAELCLSKYQTRNIRFF